MSEGMSGYSRSSHSKNCTRQYKKKKTFYHKVFSLLDKSKGPGLYFNGLTDPWLHTHRHDKVDPQSRWRTIDEQVLTHLSSEYHQEVTTSFISFIPHRTIWSSLILEYQPRDPHGYLICYLHLARTRTDLGLSSAFNVQGIYPYILIKVHLILSVVRSQSNC